MTCSKIERVVPSALLHSAEVDDVEKDWKASVTRKSPSVGHHKLGDG